MAAVAMLMSVPSAIRFGGRDFMPHLMPGKIYADSLAADARRLGRVLLLASMPG